jgi:hypothetical protein
MVLREAQEVSYVKTRNEKHAEEREVMSSRHLRSSSLRRPYVPVEEATAVVSQRGVGPATMLSWWSVRYWYRTWYRQGEELLIGR